MKIMKIIATLAIVALMSVQLVACTNNDNNNQNNTGNIDENKPNTIAINSGGIITKEEFNLAYEMLIAQYAQRSGGDISWLEMPENIKRLEEIALNQLMAERAIMNDAKDISIDDEQVIAVVSNYKAIIGDKWDTILSDNNFTETTINSYMKSRIVGGTYMQNMEKEFIDNTPSDEELKKAYEANPDYYNQIQASHILVDTEEKALEIKKLLDEGADFATLAKENSTCPSAPQGGDLGLFNRAQMVKEFSDAAFALKMNEISDPVKTEYGYHIIMKTAEQLTFDAVDKTSLITEIAYEKFGKYLNDCINNANIEVVDELKDIKVRVDEQRAESVQDK